MNFFVILNGKSIKQVLLVLMAAFFTAWFLFLENYINIPTFSEKSEINAIHKGEKDVALTFNIGWGDEKAKPILDVLEKEKVSSATFFLSGSWAERHPDLVDQIVKQGYEIGVLGYNYVEYTKLEEHEIRKDLARALEAFHKLRIDNIKYVRAPDGHFDQKTLKVANRLGLTVIHWSVNPQDWKNPGVQKIVDISSTAKKGDIILLHASDSAKQTASALPAIIENISKKKLEFISISELISNTTAETREIK